MIIQPAVVTIWILRLVLSAASWQPLSSSPPDWAWVSLPGEHTVRGVYHDSHSGAFVCVEIGRRSYVRSWREVSHHDDTVNWSQGTTTNGLQYEVATAEDAGEVIRRSDSRMTGGVSTEEGLNPNFPRGCALLAVTFPIGPAEAEELEVAHFYSATCSEEQRQRVRALLLERPSLRSIEWIPPANEPPATVEQGMSLRDLLASNGHPYDCRRSGSEGLILSYPSGQVTGVIDFGFDGAQRLVSVNDRSD